MHAKPITIVMPVPNRAGTIVDAIERIRANGDVAVEHIVVDDGSTDGTIEAVRRFDNVRLIKASGSNIYAALNVGIRAARRSIIGHPNNDDLLPPNTLAALQFLTYRFTQ